MTPKIGTKYTDRTVLLCVPPEEAKDSTKDLYVHTRYPLQNTGKPFPLQRNIRGL